MPHNVHRGFMSFAETNKTEWMGPREWVLERITSETGRSAVEAERLAGQLAGLHPSLREDLLGWWRTQEVNLDRQVHGWSLRTIIDTEHSDHVVEAFTWMSALLTDPERTLGLLSAFRDVVQPSAKDLEIAAKHRAERPQS